MATISVTEYLENKELLEWHYTLHQDKILIIETIISQFDKKNIDSVLLRNVATQMFINSITNIDLSIDNSDGIGGYDLLCINNELDNLLTIIQDEYNRYNEMLELKLQDIYRYDGNVSKIIHDEKLDIILNLISKIDFNRITTMLDSFLSEISEFTENE